MKQAPKSRFGQEGIIQLRFALKLLRRYLSVFTILLVSAYTNNCSAQVADSARIINSLARCWRVFSHDYAAIYGLEEEEISRYSKQKVCFTGDSVKLFYGVSYAPRYSIKKVNADDYSKNNFDCPKRKLGIVADSIFEIMISSVSKPSKNGTLHKMTNVVAFDGECTYLVADGVIFKMLDADAKKQPRASN
jgi:hypothetical protein